MHRITIEKRPGWERTIASQGLTYHDAQDPYWNEGVAYRFTHDQIIEIQAATQELHGMCLNATDYVIRNNLFAPFHIPEEFIPLIKCSWEDNYPYIAGRFDLAYDGTNPPKMLEYNADTPVTMPETAFIQRNWLRDHLRAGTVPSTAGQYSDLFDSLVEAWRQAAQQVSIPKPVYFACLFESENGVPTNHEIYENLQFMRSACEQAGIPTETIDLPDVGWDGRSFVDLQNKPLRSMYKLYPWDWMAVEGFAPQLAANNLAVIEAPWKMIMSSKALLPILWEMYPGNNYLLPAAFSPEKMGSDYVIKPIQGREGMNISLVQAGRTLFNTDGDFEGAPSIYQALAPLRNFDGHFPIIGSWVTSAKPAQQTGLSVFPRGGHACAMCVLEDTSPIVSRACRFVPHFVV